MYDSTQWADHIPFCDKMKVLEHQIKDKPAGTLKEYETPNIFKLSGEQFKEATGESKTSAILATISFAFLVGSFPFLPKWADFIVGVIQ